MSNDAGKELSGLSPFFVVVMGVASSGKTTVAKALNAKLGLPYIEGDDLHPKSNIDKMSQGIPLTDEDREPWLQLIRTTAENLIAEQEAKMRVADEGTAERKKGRYGVMATCSSLKRYYRDILRGTERAHRLPDHLHPVPHETLPTYFVYIRSDEQILRERIAKREGHFMKSNMLDSQLATLENPEEEENVVTIPLDASTDEQVRVAVEGLRTLVGDLHVIPTDLDGDGKPKTANIHNVM